MHAPAACPPVAGNFCHLRIWLQLYCCILPHSSDAGSDMLQGQPPAMAADQLQGELLAAGANPRLATLAWVGLQRSLLLWRLRCLEVAHSLPADGLATHSVLLDLLKYRCRLAEHGSDDTCSLAACVVAQLPALAAVPPGHGHASTLSWMQAEPTL